MDYGYLFVNGGSMLNEEQLLYAIARSRLYFKYFYTIEGSLLSLCCKTKINAYLRCKVAD